MFTSASKSDGTQLIVNYTNEVDNIDDIIATKISSDSNVFKGTLLDP